MRKEMDMPRPLLTGLLVLATALSVPAAAVGADPVSRPMWGVCVTAPVVVPSTTPGALFGVTVTGTCLFAHAGRSEMAAAQDVFAGPDGFYLVGGATYTTANGDLLRTRYEGPVQQTGPDSFAFSGTETFVGGTGRFADASGSVSYRGKAVTGPAGVPGRGLVTHHGWISY